MDKVQVIAKFQTKINRHEALLKDITDVLETVPAGTLSERAMGQLTEALVYRFNGLWARMELIERINKGGGYPISEYDFHMDFTLPCGHACSQFRQLLAHIEQQKTLHQMFRLI
jgi:hypothetical protein